MFIKIVPGLVITLALAVFFTHHGERRHEIRPARATAIATYVTASAPGMFSASTRRTETAAPPVPPPAFVPASNNVRGTRTDAGIVDLPVASAVSAAPVSMHARRSAKAGIASDSAFANQSVWCEEEAVSPRMSTAYPDMPPKGIYLWGETRNTEAKQKAVGNGLNVYKLKETSYSLGFKYDWSIDSVVGASVELLDAEVKSRQVNDTRKNDIEGYVLRGHYDSFLFGKYPVNATAFYGRIDTRGSGTFEGAGRRWSEDKHESDYFGFSAKVGLPLIFSNGLKVHTDMGIEYRRLKTGAYRVGVDNSLFDIERLDSSSLMVPLNLTVKRDYPQVWGLITPKLNLGVAAELKDGAAGVRAWNASGAAYMERFASPGGGMESLSEIEFEPSTKTFGKLGVGMDMKTVGGWELSVDYTRVFAKKYSENRFKLELGRCF